MSAVGQWVRVDIVGFRAQGSLFNKLGCRGGLGPWDIPRVAGLPSFRNIS